MAEIDDEVLDTLTHIYDEPNDDPEEEAEDLAGLAGCVIGNLENCRRIALADPVFAILFSQAMGLAKRVQAAYAHSQDEEG